MVDIFWLVVGNGGWWWVVVGRGGYILAGDVCWWIYFGWWRVVVGCGGWLWVEKGGGIV